MIQAFRCEEPEAVFHGQRSRRLSGDLQEVARRELPLLHRAIELNDLRVPPGNNLESLKGDRAGQHSIRLNGQRRICFVWGATGPEDVEIVDYHQEGEAMPKVRAKDPDRLEPVHPGEVLLHDFLEPTGLSQHQLAMRTGIPASRIHAIVKGDRSVTADTAMRLGRFFGVSPELWMGLQADYDLEAWEIENGDRLEREVRPLPRAG